MTFRGRPRGKLQPEIRKPIDIFCRWDAATQAWARILAALTSLLAPKVITLSFYDPSCATERKAE
jgi:hypothetical protein